MLNADPMAEGLRPGIVTESRCSDYALGHQLLPGRTAHDELLN